MRVGIVAILLGIVCGTAQAQDGLCRFHWQKGQVLIYRVEHHTAVTEVLGGNKLETSCQHNGTKRWSVLAVDKDGAATLELSLTALHMEQTRADGEKLLYDSDEPSRSTPGLRESLDKLLGQPLAVLKIAPSGKVLAVIKGDAANYESELPFVLILPATIPAVGQSWQRTYKVVLAPPQGTGEQYEATQKYLCKQIEGATRTIALTTSFKSLPASQLDQVPLLQKQPQGEVVFDAANGRLVSAHLVIVRELHNHQGSGSSYHLESNYTEQYVASTPQP
jgi:hypothetical protein